MFYALLLSYGLLATFICFGVGAGVSVVLGLTRAERDAWRVSHAIALLGGVLGLAFALGVLGTGATLSWHLPLSIGIAPNLLSFVIDPLAAFFIAIISTIAIAASLFGASYYDAFIGKYRLG